MLIQQAVHKQDKEALTHITNVKTEKTDDPKTIKVEIFFSENEFFSNEVLTYTVKVKENGEEPAEVIGCGIDWKDGKDLSKKKIKKKQKHKKTNETRTIVKTVPRESFFNIFESKVAPDAAPDMEDEDSDMDRLMMGLDEALDVAQDLHDMYQTDSLEYYLNFGQSFQDLMGGLNEQELLAAAGGEGSSDEDDD
jgi:nucleosome assembly protein 1-like 1